MRFMTRLPAATAAALCLALAAPAAAAEPPCLSARMIVPWGSGSGTDLIFRALADAANRAGAKPRLEVVNLSDEEGVQGAQTAARARPDGCAVLAVNQSLMTSYITGASELNWTAFTPVARLTRTPVVVGARTNATFATMREMLEAARGPDGIKAGSTMGLASHFLFLLIEDRTGASFHQVFLDGTRDRLSALLDGRIDVAEINQALTKRLASEGPVRAIAVTAASRLADMPAVPTLREQGIDLVFTIDRGVMLPKGAKPDIVEHYAKLFEAALGDPKVTALLREHGTTDGFLGPKAYAGYWQDSFAEWRRLAKRAGFYKPAD